MGIILPQQIVTPDTEIILPEGEIAIISDIHANLEALLAVLEDIDERGITQIICAGDIVGYGPNPKECIEEASKRRMRIAMGNWDYAMSTDEAYEKEFRRVNEAAKHSFRWTREQLNTDQAYRDFLKRLPYVLRFDTFVVSHGSAFEAEQRIIEYVLNRDEKEDKARVRNNFVYLRSIGKLASFFGHSHSEEHMVDYPKDFPTNVIADPVGANKRQKKSPAKTTTDVRELVSGGVYLENVGSVGQPRDRDNRACYKMYEPSENLVRTVRVDYPIEQTQKKIRSLDLPEHIRDFLATRLKEAR